MTFNDMAHENLDEILNKSGLPTCQIELIKEIFLAAKVKNPKNRKYSENWLLLCLLFHIRSPNGYNHLRNQNLLPLPCTNTVRAHLLAVKIGCGFDHDFFKLLKKFFIEKSDHQKKVILTFDEIFLRESLSVKTRTLTYHGLEDFGDGFEKKLKEKANHALVFMIQSLADNVHQPIAMFASRGPVKGIELAKIILKDILLLENAGVQVIGITSDGASTNRTLWSELDVSGKLENFKNSFKNPFNLNPNVFVFSDSPHLIKTVRNRLFTKKTLKIHPSKPDIKWSYYYEKVFMYDSRSMLKVCPKLTRSHFDLNNMTKMNVKYATQLTEIFSSSVAVGMEFYKNKNYDGFYNCEEKFYLLK